MAVTRVFSTNSGHCTAIPGTVAPLWEPAMHCANVRGAVPSTMLPTPYTSLVLSSLQDPQTAWARPSKEAPTWTRTRPRHVGPSKLRHATPRGRDPPQQPPRRLQEPQWRRCDLRKAKDTVQDSCMPGAMISSTPHCTSYSRRPLCAPDSGKNDEFSPLPYMYTAPPCVYKRGRWSLSYPSGLFYTLCTTHRAHTLLSPDIGTRLNQLLL